MPQPLRSPWRRRNPTSVRGRRQTSVAGRGLPLPPAGVRPLPGKRGRLAQLRREKAPPQGTRSREGPVQAPRGGGQKRRRSGGRNTLPCPRQTWPEPRGGPRTQCRIIRHQEKQGRRRAARAPLAAAEEREDRRRCGSAHGGGGEAGRLGVTGLGPWEQARGPATRLNGGDKIWGKSPHSGLIGPAPNTRGPGDRECPLAIIPPP